MEYKVKGNIIPLSWYHAIVKSNGKPDMNSIAIMGELLYWNRPVWKNGHWETSYPGNKFWINYKKLSKMLNLTQKDIQRSLKRLEELGFIERQMDMAVKGQQLTRRMFVRLQYDKLESIGGAETVDNSVDNHVDSSVDRMWIESLVTGQFRPDLVDKVVR